MHKQPATPGWAYKSYSTASPSGKPALMRYYELLDLIESARNLPDIEHLEIELMIAELEYSTDQWSIYAVNLATKLHGRRNIIAKNLLNAA